MEHRPLEENSGLRVEKECGQAQFDAFCLFRSHEVPGSLSEHFFRRVVQYLPALWTDVGERAGLVYVQDEIVYVLNETPIERLALAQGLFCSPSLGDILEDDGDPRRSVVESGGKEFGLKEELLNVPQEAELFHNLTAVERLDDPILYQWVVERSQVRLLNILSYDIVTFYSCKRADRIVRLDDPAVAVKHQHQVR